MITTLSIIAVGALAVAYLSKEKAPTFSSESQHYVFDLLMEQGYFYINNEDHNIRMIKITKRNETPKVDICQQLKEDLKTGYTHICGNSDPHEEQILINPDGQVINLGQQVI